MSNQLIPHLFRTEYSRIVAVLCKTYGISTIEIAEDFVSDSFYKASETWKAKGIPDNPKAWLYTVAKNKAKDHFKRNDLYRSKIERELIFEKELEPFQELDLSEHNIQDSQLRIIFAICHPLNPKESQVALALRILCGFGIEEIANALLSTKSTINKKLYRAKEKLKANGRDFVFPKEEEFEERTENVLSVIYLLFNEGYYSSTKDQKIQKDLCLEAMRLLQLLLSYEKTDLPRVNALMALFCFHASRFEARIDEQGNQVLLNDQDQSKWDQALIEKGEEFLNASSGAESKYHLEALIAFSHVRMLDDETRKWEAVLQFYNRLLQLDYSPIAALNRTYALSKVKGKEAAIEEALKIKLEENNLYYALLADLYEGIDSVKQVECLKKGLDVCKTESDRSFFIQKMSVIK
ncbi:MAG: sigma-70 family RNA polymerase sigma factor [Flavobacteriales bacterium]|nr:sigma-70 family RNA polymerase sigma factor [Flavobacteriales bacterium]